MKAMTPEEVAILFPVGTEVMFDAGANETIIVRDEVISEPYPSNDIRDGVPFLKVQTRSYGGQFVDMMWLPNDVAIARLRGKDQ